MISGRIPAKKSITVLDVNKNPVQKFKSLVETAAFLKINRKRLSESLKTGNGISKLYNNKYYVSKL